MITKISIFIVVVFSVVAGIVSTEHSNTSNITLPNDHLLRGTTIPVLTQEEIWELEAITAHRIGLNGEDRTVYQPREGSGADRKDFTRPNLKRTRSFSVISYSEPFPCDNSVPDDDDVKKNQ